MGYGESDVVDALNNYFDNNCINALSYRHKQGRFTDQWCDINVDSSDNRWYLALEIKSKRGKRALNFNNDFTTNKDGVHQLQRLIDYAMLTGRNPMIIVFCRMGRGRPNQIYTFDALDLWTLWNSGSKSLKAKEFDEYNTSYFDEVEFK